MKTLAEIDDWANNTDEGTWVTHYLQGLIFFLLGALRSFDLGAGLAAGAFVHREISNFASAVKKHGWRRAIRHKLLDGIGDALFAALGVFTGLLWHLGGAWAALAAFAGSAVVWTMMAKVARRRRAKEGR